MAILSDPQTWLAFLTLTALEIVLGIDNIIFISILVGRLPRHLQKRGRTIGLGLAMLTRILLLLSITWVMPRTMTSPARRAARTAMLSKGCMGAVPEIAGGDGKERAGLCRAGRSG